MKKTSAVNFHMMIKPIGPICNLNCTYCYYLGKESSFGEEQNWQITDSLLERFISQYITNQDVRDINFSWQGGEPTLLGLDFFKKVVKLQKKYCPSTKIISNDLQTNGVLLDDAWCDFLRDNKFLVGLSIDGPEHLHNHYRVDKNQQPTFDKVVSAARLLQKNKVEFNTLTVVNRINAREALKVYRFLRDELGIQYMQFIPCVEPKNFAREAPQSWDKSKLPRINEAAARPGSAESVVTDWSVDPDDYGNFLCNIFDEWIKNDVGKVFVRLFDTALGIWMGLPSADCRFGEICGKALAFEHDGSVYSCDHYVYPEHHLGNIREKTLEKMASSDKQMRFGLDKSDTLSQQCLNCTVRFACNGGCPKNRFVLTADSQEELNYLCPGLQKFFKHIDPGMKLMVQELQAGRTADKVMKKAQESICL